MLKTMFFFNKLTEKIQTLKNEELGLDEIKNKIDIVEFGLTINTDQFPVNITIIYNQLINTKIEWWKF